MSYLYHYFRHNDLYNSYFFLYRWVILIYVRSVIFVYNSKKITICFIRIFILVYALWILSMFGYIFIRMDFSTDTNCNCSLSSNCYIMSITNIETVTINEITIHYWFWLFSLFRNRLFEPAQIIDIIKGLVLLGCATPMCFMDISVVYHTVRAQAAIKLYMFFNMLEVSIII